MKNAFLTLSVLLFLTFNISAQSVATAQTVKFKTSAKCGMCKKRLERDMSLTKGVEKAVLNLDDKSLSIIYNSQKTNPTKLKKAVSLIGYDADEIVANQKAHDRLPDCCQKTAALHMD